MMHQNQIKIGQELSEPRYYLSLPLQMSQPLLRSDCKLVLFHDRLLLLPFYVPGYKLATVEEVVLLCLVVPGFSSPVVLEVLIVLVVRARCPLAYSEGNLATGGQGTHKSNIIHLPYGTDAGNVRASCRTRKLSTEGEVRKGVWLVGHP
jgi:hypothetical protein